MKEDIMTEQWHTESAEAFRRPTRDGEVAVGLCGICRAPVLPSHDPTPIEWVGTADRGWIHGAFDCTDAARCDGQLVILGGAGAETTAQCVLPDDHTGDHIPGDPA
jgi:hypothetical protein